MFLSVSKGEFVQVSFARTYRADYSRLRLGIKVCNNDKKVIQGGI